MNKILNFVVQLILLAFLVFGLHYIFQQVLGVLDLWDSTSYSLYIIYLFQLMLSIIMIVGIIAAGKSLPNSLGFVFLGLLTLKCLGNYLFIKPALDSNPSNDFVKHNFLIVFLLFLIFDVYVAFRILNQQNNKAED